MTTHDRITIGGFVSLALLMLALFAWLRDDIAGLRAEVRDNSERLSGVEARLTGVETRLAAQNARLNGFERTLADMQDDIEALQEDLNAVRERLARVEGELAAIQIRLQGAFAFGMPGGETPRPRQNALRAPPAGSETAPPPEG